VDNPLFLWRIPPAVEERILDKKANPVDKTTLIHRIFVNPAWIQPGCGKSQVIHTLPGRILGVYSLTHLMETATK
jgi:hypothetical protein